MTRRNQLLKAFLLIVIFCTAIVIAGIRPGLFGTNSNVPAPTTCTPSPNITSCSFCWQKIGKFDGEAWADEFGSSVSLSSDGKTVAIGAPANKDTVFASSNGQSFVRIFQWTEWSTSKWGWIQIGADIDEEASRDESGYSVSLSSDGKTVAIGAPENDGNGDHSGHVRIFQWKEYYWMQMGADIDGEAYDDNSGYSVSLSSDGKIVAIGAFWNDGNGYSSGHVRIFQWNYD